MILGFVRLYIRENEKTKAGVSAASEAAVFGYVLVNIMWRIGGFDVDRFVKSREHKT